MQPKGVPSARKAASFARYHFIRASARANPVRPIGPLPRLKWTKSGCSIPPARPPIWATSHPRTAPNRHQLVVGNRPLSRFRTYTWRPRRSGRSPKPYPAAPQYSAPAAGGASAARRRISTINSTPCLAASRTAAPPHDAFRQAHLAAFPAPPRRRSAAARRRKEFGSYPHVRRSPRDRDHRRG